MSLSVTAADVERAIATIEESRASHVAWLDHPPNCPDCARQSVADLVGDRAHHQRCVDEYDHVLAVLRALV